MGPSPIDPIAVVDNERRQSIGSLDMMDKLVNGLTARCEAAYVVP